MNSFFLFFYDPYFLRLSRSRSASYNHIDFFHAYELWICLTDRGGAMHLRKDRHPSARRGGTVDASSQNRQRTDAETPVPNPARVPGKERGAGLIQSTSGPGPVRNAAATQEQANRYVGTVATFPIPYISLGTAGKETKSAASTPATAAADPTAGYPPGFPQ